MASATVTSKGRCDSSGRTRPTRVECRDRIEFIFNGGTGHYEIVPAIRSVTALKGSVRKLAKPVSIEDINSAIGEQ